MDALDCREISFSEGLQMMIAATETPKLIEIIATCDASPGNVDKETYDAIKLEICRRHTGSAINA